MRPPYRSESHGVANERGIAEMFIIATSTPVDVSLQPRSE